MGNLNETPTASFIWHLFRQKSTSGGGVKGSSSHFSRSVLVNVFNLNETTRLASPHLYFATCFSQHRSSIVASAVHICVSTALRDVPMKLFIFSNCLMFLKKISICHLALYNSAIVEAASTS